MIIARYQDKDETEWLRCRLLSFLDSSYYRDVLTKKPHYSHDAICLVAKEKEKVLGLIDVEIEDQVGDCCVAGQQRGAVIWHLAVLPEYRHKQIATSLWQEAKKQLIDHHIHYCEVWTQEDPAANHWYLKQGFQPLKEHYWLRCTIQPQYANRFLNTDDLPKFYGIDELTLKVHHAYREALVPYCDHIDEVRLYGLSF